MSTSPKKLYRLLSSILCMAMLLSCVALPVNATGSQPLAVDDPAAIPFDTSALDRLDYPDGTVSAWLEYDCGNGLMTDGTNRSYLQVAVGTGYDQFLAYCTRLSQSNDYTDVYTTGPVGGSTDPIIYARYKAVDGSHIVYTYLLTKLDEVRVIVDTNPDMTGTYADGFVYESTTGETAQPMMVMYGLSMAENGYHIDTTSTQYCTDKVNSGALIVIRMPDNSLFINDGGSNEQWNDEACTRFLTFLREMTGKTEGEKIVINTWFLSHAHTDHFEGFARFVDHHHDQLDLQSVMYNIDSERLGTARDLTEILQMYRAYFPAVKYYKPHTGERFNIAGIDFDVVYTQEDRFYPTSNGQTLLIDHLDGKSEYASHGSRNGTYREECFFETVYSSENDALVATPTTYDYSDFNDTSTVLKVTFPTEVIDADENMTAILYGDVNRVDQTMLKIYNGTDMLKSNIMMIPHHGHDAHPELAQVSEADVFLYTQRASAIYGPNGIADYGVDVGGTYRPALVYNYLAMQEHIEKTKIYWQGTETVCLTFGADAQALPTGMVRDASLSASTGICAYTCETIHFKYEGWSLLTTVSGKDASSATGVAITTKRIRFDQATSLNNEGRYMIVHDQTDNVLMYDAIARADGQTKPDLATSMEVGSGQAASNGLVEAYYKVTDTAQPDVETKTSIYCTRDKRDAALWILGQDGVTGSGTALNTTEAKFGGTTAYSATTFYKGTSSDDAYWYSVKDNDYVDSSNGDQWRYLRVSGSPLFHNEKAVTNYIEFFEDGTCVIYYYSSATSIRFLSITPEGNWIRSKTVKQSKLTDEMLAGLKLRLYEYKTRSGAKTIAYDGPMTYEILKGTSKSKVIDSIAATFRVLDSSARNRPIPCSGTAAKVGCYWLDGSVSASSVGTSTVTLRYRDDDGTDAQICTLDLKVQEQLHMDTFVTTTDLTVTAGQAETDGQIIQVYHDAAGYSGNGTTITLDMLTDANGDPISADATGTFADLILTDNGQTLATGLTLTVQEDASEEEPGIPTEPSDPSEPEDPEIPSEPSAPSDPSEPVDPEIPSEPSDPSDPSEPEDPEVPVVTPTLTLKYPSLSFEAEILYNVYFIAENFDDVSQMGLATFDTELIDGTVETATDVIPGFDTDGTLWRVCTNGIPAKNLGDTLYFKVYAQLADGSYVYSDMKSYSAITYANTILNRASSSDYMRSLVVAMLNYGTEAQLYFGHKTDDLMNAALTAQQQALVAPYAESMMDPVIMLDGSKITSLTFDGTSFTRRAPTVSFDGAFSINYYFTAAYAPDDGMMLYYWDLDDYNAASVLSVDNATGSMEMLATDVENQYWGKVPDIAAKLLDQTVFVVGIYEHEGVTYTTSVLNYSIGKYCEGLAANPNSAQQSFAQATAVYGYYAKEYFANL